MISVELCLLALCFEKWIFQYFWSFPLASELGTGNKNGQRKHSHHSNLAPAVGALASCLILYDGRPIACKYMRFGSFHRLGSLGQGEALGARFSDKQ